MENPAPLPDEKKVQLTKNIPLKKYIACYFFPEKSYDRVQFMYESYPFLYTTGLKRYIHALDPDNKNTSDHEHLKRLLITFKRYNYLQKFISLFPGNRYHILRMNVANELNIYCNKVQNEIKTKDYTDLQNNQLRTIDKVFILATTFPSWKKTFITSFILFAFLIIALIGAGLLLNAGAFPLLIAVPVLTPALKFLAGLTFAKLTASFTSVIAAHIALSNFAIAIITGISTYITILAIQNLRNPGFLFRFLGPTTAGATISNNWVTHNSTPTGFLSFFEMIRLYFPFLFLIRIYYHYYRKQTQVEIDNNITAAERQKKLSKAMGNLNPLQFTLSLILNPVYWIVSLLRFFYMALFYVFELGTRQNTPSSALRVFLKFLTHFVFMTVTAPLEVISVIFNIPFIIINTTVITVIALGKWLFKLGDAKANVENLNLPSTSTPSPTPNGSLTSDSNTEEKLTNTNSFNHERIKWVKPNGTFTSSAEDDQTSDQTLIHNVKGEKGQENTSTGIFWSPTLFLNKFSKAGQPAVFYLNDEDIPRSRLLNKRDLDGNVANEDSDEYGHALNSSMRLASNSAADD